MAAPTKHVLRLRRTDNKSEHLLINVTKEGQGELDLKLIGTNKSELFVLSFAEADTKSYQDRNFRGNFEEWKTLLKLALRQRRPESTLPDALQGIETVAAINGSTATITIRKNVDGITQRLGTIHLPENTAGTEIDIFDWVDTATAEAYDLRSQLEALQASVESQKDAVAKLTTELDMLVRAKKEHEDELLSKFAALLNAKKLKIRDQQRLLQGAQIDTEAAQKVTSARSSRKAKNKARASRGGKRKAVEPPPSATLNDREDSEDSGSVDASDEGSRHDQETPEPFQVDADVATEDEDETISHISNARPISSRRTLRSRDKDLESMAVDDEPLSQQQAHGTRDLPSRTTQCVASQPATNMDDEDEETDDEL